MNYDDLYLLKLIKQLQTAVVALASMVGYLKSQTITPADFAQLISSGEGDPNVLGIVPARPDLINLRWQTVNGAPVTLWTWLANATSWT